MQNVTERERQLLWMFRVRKYLDCPYISFDALNMDSSPSVPDPGSFLWPTLPFEFAGGAILFVRKVRWDTLRHSSARSGSLQQSLYFHIFGRQVFTDPKCCFFLHGLVMCFFTGLFLSIRSLACQWMDVRLTLGLNYRFWAWFKSLAFVRVILFFFYTIRTSPKKDETAVYDCKSWLIPGSYSHRFTDKFLFCVVH